MSNGTVVTFNTYEATCTYIAGYLLPTDDRYREHHDHIWIVLQFEEEEEESPLFKNKI